MYKEVSRILMETEDLYIKNEDSHLERNRQYPGRLSVCIE